MNVDKIIREDFQRVVREHNLADERVEVSCRALDAQEAIGTPEHDDYPILKGKEVIVEAVFHGARGHAFASSFEQMSYPLHDLVAMELDVLAKRASFFAALNAVYRYLGIIDKTVHCKDAEPQECARQLLSTVDFPPKVLLIGFQPRFLDVLAGARELRVIDLDPDNIGRVVSGVTVEPPEMTDDALKWCDMIFATGSTIVNGTITKFLDQPKPAVFYGVTIGAPGKILGLNTYCACGR